MRTVILALAFAAYAAAFAPSPIRTRAVLHTPRISPFKASYLSEIEDGDERRRKNGPAYKRLREEKEGRKQEGIAPTDYDDFVDADGFDGGDGQVGVVGDGSNAMESFDQSQAVSGQKMAQSRKDLMVGGAESKSTRKNVFGYTTGYADELKKQGMVKIDEYGEDKLAQRRQQLENWRNQRELRGQQNQMLSEMASYTGVEYDERRATQSYFNALESGKGLNDDAKFNIYKGDVRPSEASNAAEGLTKGAITETIEMACSFPKPAFGEIQIHNDVMSYEDFVVGFSADSDTESFTVSPPSGQLNRRGGDPTNLSLVFKPNSPGGVREAWIIVSTEESKFTYHIVGSVM